MDEKLLKMKWLDKAEVTISEDKTEVYLKILGNARRYKVDELIELLYANKVVQGISKGILQKVIELDINYKSVIVARSKQPIDGTDGNYRFYFDLDNSNKTTVLEDGTVDYSMLGRVHIAQEDDILAEYTNAVMGVDGINVFGQVIPARKARELRPLSGKGFNVSDDRKVYTAAHAGKVEYMNGKLVVLHMFVVEGEVNSTTGDIKFPGDILVTGNVISNMRIEATGNITIEGSVEAAEIIAGKDVIIKNGMLGNGKGYVKANGNVSAKFFELTKVRAGGNVNANTIMNCDILSNQKVIVSGRRGAIIGGAVAAVESVMASMIGNKAEVDTIIKVGMDKGKARDTIRAVEQKIKTVQRELEEADIKVRKLNNQIQKSPISMLMDARRENLKIKIEKTAELSKHTKLREELIDKELRCGDGNIIVNGRIFPNTNVFINGVSQMLKDEFRNITIVKKEADIHMYSNSL